MNNNIINNNNNNPRTVEDVIKDFKGRRSGIIKALTKDVDDFYQLCDPNNPNLCLYGFPDQSWEVNLPPPSDLPEPRLGINFARDYMTKHDWLAMVALHSDAWLYSVANYFANKFNFDKADRKRLFNKITDVSSICDALDGRAKKRAKTQGGGLPEDILVQEVLSRVPAKDLLLYRSVSKIWRSMIDDPKFVSDHLKSYKKNSEESHLLVIYNSSKRWWLLSDEQVLIRRGDSFRKVTDLRVLRGRDGAYDLSYVDGVILVRKGKSRSFREIILWNPSINGSLKIPNTNSLYESMKDATYFELGFGYNASSNDYKVVAIVYPHAEVMYTFGERYRAMVPGLVHVYSLSNNSWSSNLGVSPPPFWTVGKQVFVHGAIHWINFGPNYLIVDDLWYKNRDSSIVCFDIENEVFKYIELPKGMKRDDEPKEKFPTILQGSLGIFCAYENSRNDIWVMKDYGVTESWTKCYTFTLHFDNLMHISNNGRLLFAVVGEGVKSYDVKSNNKVKDLARTYSKSANYTVFTYVESLVLSKEIAKCCIEPTK